MSSFAQKKCKCLTHTHAQTHTPACGGTVPATLLVNESSPYPPVQAPLDPPAQNLKTYAKVANSFTLTSERIQRFIVIVTLGIDICEDQTSANISL